jgi:CheY-like chemotaxis protein
VEGGAAPANSTGLSAAVVSALQDFAMEDSVSPDLATPGSLLGFELPSGELKILIVDDEPVNRQVLLNHLALEQFVVESASSGAEALRRIEEGWIPDLVLLDVMMPRMSGFEVCRTLRRQFRLTELPVIFLTAKNQPEDHVTGLAQGANDYLTKPVTRGELLSRVRLHLELLWVHRHLEDLVQERTAEVKTLSGLLPVCGLCKSVRDDTGYWSQLEDYLRHHSDAMVTHGICPECLRQHYGSLFQSSEAGAD